ncbi:hypothetical protein M0R19_02110 [Candidatus Pacearchaeota archaeon]|nr:hypothetical protein [Candidatus Pacearchaeota archaeon]
MNWTKDDLIFLKENYSKKIPLKNISEQMNKSIRSIQHKAARIGISRPRFLSDKPSNKQPQGVIDKRYYENNKEKVYQRKMARRKRLKQEMINLLGGKCSICGYNKCINALDFHHKGDKEKEITILIKNDSREKILKETKKCILLCANCHREVHHKGP